MDYQCINETKPKNAKQNREHIGRVIPAWLYSIWWYFKQWVPQERHQQIECDGQGFPREAFQRNGSIVQRTGANDYDITTCTFERIHILHKYVCREMSNLISLLWHFTHTHNIYIYEYIKFDYRFVTFSCVNRKMRTIPCCISLQFLIDYGIKNTVWRV